MHTLHESSSSDGVNWDEPSAPQLTNLYAPTIMKEEGRYRLWYTDVSAEPWCFRYAESSDGSNWEVAPQPVLQVEQAWEHQRLFYPTVLKLGATYFMWYGSYSQSAGEPTTALGLARSDDGRHWHKHPANPIFGPEPSHHWESHYTTSQSVLLQPDGSLRIWYASRPKPPFMHKYFAIGTALWKKP